MIITNSQLFRQDGSTFVPQFFLQINVNDKNSVNVNILNLEGTPLDFSWFTIEHTTEVKNFIEYISNVTINKLEEKYPSLIDLNIGI